MIGIQQTAYTVNYSPSLEECVCAVRLGWRGKSETTTLSANDMLRRRTMRTEAGKRLDAIWYRAMQRAGEL